MTEALRNEAWADWAGRRVLPAWSARARSWDFCGVRAGKLMLRAVF